MTECSDICAIVADEMCAGCPHKAEGECDHNHCAMLSCMYHWQDRLAGVYPAAACRDSGSYTCGDVCTAFFTMACHRCPHVDAGCMAGDFVNHAHMAECARQIRSIFAGDYPDTLNP